MNSAYFKALELKVYLPDDHRYHDDGSVDSIPEHTGHLREQYESGRLLAQDVVARYETLDCQGITHHHIYYLDQVHPLQITLRGHEETQILERTGLLRSLENALLSHGIYMDLSSSKDHELVADVGGIYALVVRGMPLEWIKGFVRSVNSPSLSNAVTAFERYRVSWLEKKCIQFRRALA